MGNMFAGLEKAFMAISVAILFVIVAIIFTLSSINHDKTKQILEYKPAYDCVRVLPQTTPDCPAELKAYTLKTAALEAQLNLIARETAAAKLRADARETAQNQQTQRDQDALKTAPRDASGNIICDADCLRARFKN